MALTPEERKEYIKEYCKKWYVENKEVHLKNILTPVTCECGFETAVCNLKRHQKTKLHSKKLSTKV